MTVKEYYFGQSKATIFSIISYSTTLVSFLFYITGYFLVKWGAVTFQTARNNVHISIGMWAICEEWIPNSGEEKWKYCYEFLGTSDYLAFQVMCSMNVPLMFFCAALSICYLSCARLNKSKRTVAILCTATFLAGFLTLVACIVFIYCLKSYTSEELSGKIKDLLITSSGESEEVTSTDPVIDYSFVMVATSGVLEIISCALMLCELYLVDFKTDPYANYQINGLGVRQYGY